MEREKDYNRNRGRERRRMDEGGGLNSVSVSGEQTHAGMGVLLAPAVQDTSCP